MNSAVVDVGPELYITAFDFVEESDVGELVEVCCDVVLIFVLCFGFGLFVGDEFVGLVTLPDINMFPVSFSLTRNMKGRLHLNSWELLKCALSYSYFADVLFESPFRLCLV